MGHCSLFIVQWDIVQFNYNWKKPFCLNGFKINNLTTNESQFGLVFAIWLIRMVKPLIASAISRKRHFIQIIKW